MTVRRKLSSWMVWLLAATAGLAPIGSPASAAAPVPFAFTGAAQSWVVPPNVFSITVEAWGAQGGIWDVATCSTGGFGGYVRSVVAVTPGETLQVFVGGRGSDITDVDPNAGGFNGGGDGQVPMFSGSRGGGGASDIRRAPFELTDRLVVAGGGGGAGNFTASAGGAGGAPAGGSAPAPRGGGGGTQTGGGAAGTNDSNSATTTPATPGSFGVGGNGGISSQAISGGGGGGGWFGGGGAGADSFGGSGGGGSSYGPDGSVFQNGVNGFSGVCNQPAKHGSLQITPIVSAGTFTTLVPQRILDTRIGLGGPVGKLAANATFELQVTGRGGVPNVGVAAVAVNLTVDAPSGEGFLTAYPCDAARPTASNGNYTAGRAAGTAGLIKLSPTGTLCIFTLASAHLIVDVSGYVSGGGPTAASRFHSLAPGRVIDTRQSAIVGSGSRLVVPMLGVHGVPSTGVTAVTVNLTATGTTGNGFLTAYPCDQTLPIVSNVNYAAGQTVANLATVKLSASGSICVYALTATHVIVDVSGWFGAAGAQSGSLINPVTPGRLLDTRIGLGTPAGVVPSGGLVIVKATDREGVPATGVTAVVVSVLATMPTGPGFLTLYPCNVTRPVASNLNFFPGQTIANQAFVKLDLSGQLCVYSLTATHIVVDVTGWVSAPDP